MHMQIQQQTNPITSTIDVTALLQDKGLHRGQVTLLCRLSKIIRGDGHGGYCSVSFACMWMNGGMGEYYVVCLRVSSAEPFVSLTSSYFTGGQIPNLEFGIFTFKWVDWWVVILGFSFVITTLYAPRGIGGLIEYIFKKD